MNPIRIKQLDHVVLRVNDLERSVRFYRDILGCPEARINERIGLYQYQAGSSIIDLVPLDSELGRRGGDTVVGTNRNVDHIALTLAEFDEAAIRAHLEAHGCHPYDAAERFGAEGTGPSLMVDDPDGNPVELKGPPA